MTLFPTHAALESSFNGSVPFFDRKPRSLKSHNHASSGLRPCTISDIYLARDALEDTKRKAQKIGDVAVHEFDKASHKAQDVAGPIELHSFKYFAACTMGGILACVRTFKTYFFWGVSPWP